MVLRLHPDSEQVIASWRSRNPDSEDRRLVGKVIRDVQNGTWQRRWHAAGDPSDPTITVISARTGLRLWVRLWTEDPGQFAVVRILEEAPPDEEGA